MRYYKFHMGDYQSHTSHLNEMEDLAFRRLLDWFYLHEKPLPDDIQEVGRMIRMRTHSECIASVLREFFEKTPDGWVNTRAVEEIKLANEKKQKASQSALKRWGKPEDANALQTQSEGNAPITHYPLPTTHNPQPKRERSPSGSRLTATELDPEWKKFCLSERPELDPALVFDNFCNYWKALPGSKGNKTDWFLTWKNWVRRETTLPSNKSKEVINLRRGL